MSWQGFTLCDSAVEFQQLNVTCASFYPLEISSCSRKCKLLSVMLQVLWDVLCQTLLFWKLWFFKGVFLPLILYFCKHIIVFPLLVLSIYTSALLHQIVRYLEGRNCVLLTSVSLCQCLAQCFAKFNYLYIFPIKITC